MNFLRAEIPTAHSSKLVCAIRQANFLYLRYGPGLSFAVKGCWPQMILPFLILRCTPTIRELIEATPLSLSSRSATSLSVLAPAQRAGAQRLCAVAHTDELRRSSECLLWGGVERKWRRGGSNRPP